MTLLNLLTILNTQSNLSTLLLWQGLITTSGQIFSPNHPPFPLLMLWYIWTPWSDQFFWIIPNVFFLKEKNYACIHDSTTYRDRFFKSQFKTTEYDEIIFCFDMPIRIKYYKESVWHAQWLPKVVLPWLVSCCFDPIATIRTLKYF